MNKIYFEVKYPCGYELKLYWKISMFTVHYFNEGDFKLCPLHGKNCPNKNKEGEKE